MHFPASQIAIAEPMCPSCGFTTAEGDRACVDCGYGFEFAAQLLPYDAPELRKFIDHNAHLTRDDIRRGQRALSKLRATFPQVTLCTCVVDVPEQLSMSEFGFWLLNQSVPNGPRVIERQLHTILLCVDTNRAEASLTVGYGLDPFIDDATLEDCLKKIRKPLRTLNYGGALQKLCRSLRTELIRGHQTASQSYADYAARNKQVRHRERRQPSASPTPAPEGQPTQSQPAHHTHDSAV